ncbi:MEAB protein [Metarhizium rileyi]|uniref:MEAB protein n=1 Tax=Metarhizium rileyi (strain RCEF 4871) TaxID=1649241 RepID=A0A167JLF2_METRR|nr:MEAB protein [Metarhizium rileyi RCEF 4871]
MSIDNKLYPPRDESDDSASSSPEREQNASGLASGNSHHAVQDTQQPKRKGGRKPIYATSEERKQRNRQAQAAFRERRTEYIKQLEETIRVHESNLQNLQSAHRNAADECLMLRYKNSLLERILLEKGVDVQAELQVKTDSPNLGPAHVPQNIVQPPPIQRPIMNRQTHNRKSNSSIAPKLEPVPVPVGSGMQAPKSATSPKNRPMPTSHSSSPNNGASTFSPAPSDSISMRGSISAFIHQQRPLGGATQLSGNSVPHNGTTRRAATSASFYPTPTFHNQAEPTDQKYDSRSEMVGNAKSEPPNGQGGFRGGFNSDTTQPMLLSPSSTGPAHHEQGGHQASLSNNHFPTMTQLHDHQTLDWDPFGLTASMTFPTHQFTFDETSLR